MKRKWSVSRNNLSYILKELVTITEVLGLVTEDEAQAFLNTN
jgi:hypothetical protein